MTAHQTEMPAPGTNKAFSFTVETNASRDAIWALWTDVSTWKQWDRRLRDATLEGPLQEGAKGTIMPLSGGPASFEVTQVDPQNSYTFETKLPLARLIVQRSFVSEPGAARTIFRHNVSFAGPLGSIWAGQFGPGFRTALPPTMKSLAAIAEGQAQ